YLPGAELRARIEQAQRIELRVLGRAAAAIDERFAGESETPAAQIGRARAKGAPLFLFPAVEQATEVEWRSTSARRYHGRIVELAADTRRARAERGARVLFAMPSVGVAERVAEMLAEYNVQARLALAGESGAAEKGAVVVATGPLSVGFDFVH